MARRSGSAALLYSQAEFAYILLFIALGALSLLFLQYRAAREEAAFLLERIAMMDEKQNAAYPCWVRPDGIIPEVAGKLVIHSADFTEISRTLGGRSEVRTVGSVGAETAYAASGSATAEAAAVGGTPGTQTAYAASGSATASAVPRPDRLFSAVRQLFQTDNQFAARNRCYIRVLVENRTNDYEIYNETARVLKSLGIVVVIE